MQLCTASEYPHQVSSVLTLEAGHLQTRKRYGPFLWDTRDQTLSTHGELEQTPEMTQALRE